MTTVRVAPTVVRERVRHLENLFRTIVGVRRTRGNQLCKRKQCFAGSLRYDRSPDSDSSCSKTFELAEGLFQRSLGHRPRYWVARIVWPKAINICIGAEHGFQPNSRLRSLPPGALPQATVKQGLWPGKYIASILSILFLALFALPATATPINTHADIQFWIGTGENQAGLIVDWNGQDDTDQSLVWGYRWDGTATALDMLRDVVTTDDRLFAKLGESGGFGTPVYGVGYDANDNGEFGVTPEDYAHPFNAQGLAIVETAHEGQPTDPGDHYADGWRWAYWQHALAVGLPADWSYGLGVTSQTLVNDAWTSLAFTRDTSSQQVFAPSNLMAALPPTLPGDFNRDGAVDAADYSVWRDTLGDTASYQLWRTNYGASNAAAASAVVPEPASILSLLFLTLIATHLCYRTRKSDS